MEGHNSIALSEILAYASEYEIEDRDVFIKHMCVMDRAYRKYTKSKKT